MLTHDENTVANNSSVAWSQRFDGKGIQCRINKASLVKCASGFKDMSTFLRMMLVLKLFFFQVYLNLKDVGTGHLMLVVEAMGIQWYALLNAFLHIFLVCSCQQYSASNAMQSLLPLLAYFFHPEALR